MINEIFPLAVSMQKHQIEAESFHRKYKPIPNISVKAPCVHIILSSGKVANIRTISAELGKSLRKYGTNNGTYPGLNLTPLYRISNVEAKSTLKKLKPEDLTPVKIRELKSWCTAANDNWDKNIRNKYRLSIVDIPKELHRKLSNEKEFTPIFTLISETNMVADPEVVRTELETELFKKLEQKIDVDLALKVLFQLESDKKPGEKEKDRPENLSVFFDCERLIENGIPAVSELFVKEFNQKLMASESSSNGSEEGNRTDAFGRRYNDFSEKMPSVKLAGGFEVTLRTMFNAHHCQYRYKKIEDGSYPISPELRIELQAALNWIGDAERKDVTWTNLDKNVIMFAFPFTPKQGNSSFTRLFKATFDKTATFEAEAKQFITNLRKTNAPGTDSNADRIQFFILHKIDKARSKVVYSKSSDTKEIGNRSTEWTLGCWNLPSITFLGKNPTLFPSEIPHILNRIWKLDGTVATDKFQPVPRYHGVELLLDAELPVDQDLHMAVQSSANLAVFVGRKLKEYANQEKKPVIWWRTKDYLSILGLLLYRKGIRKENYMEDFPYQYGQLLKVSDELHAFYCKVVRNGEFPPQLAGSGIYPSAVELPIRSLHLLSQRMNPYITWAKSYQHKNITAEGYESWRARWYLSLYEPIVAKLYSVWDRSSRLNDVEKAQMFIGFLAAFPKRESPAESIDQDEETK